MTTKKPTVIFLAHFFIKLSGFQTFFEKLLPRFFSKNINTCMRHYWLNRYCAVLPLVKISVQLSKSPCMYNSTTALSQLPRRSSLCISNGQLESSTNEQQQGAKEQSFCHGSGQLYTFMTSTRRSHELSAPSRFLKNYS
jgi:hypothetical protein